MPFHVNRTIPDYYNKTFMLQRFDIECTTVTIFEIRYTNGQLCRCGKVGSPGRLLSERCRLKLLLDINVKLSFEQVRVGGENCTIYFSYIRDGESKETKTRSFWARYWTGGVMTRSFVVPHPSTRESTHFTGSYTSTIAPLFPTSSLLPGYSELRNSTMTSTPIRLVMLVAVNENVVSHSAFRKTVFIGEGDLKKKVMKYYVILCTICNMSDHVLSDVQPSLSMIPFFSGVILTPTLSILQSSSAKQSPVLSTMISTLIEASPTTTEVLPSSTLSPAEVKKKRRKEGKRRWISRECKEELPLPLSIFPESFN